MMRLSYAQCGRSLYCNWEVFALPKTHVGELNSKYLAFGDQNYRGIKNI